VKLYIIQFIFILNALASIEVVDKLNEVSSEINKFQNLEHISNNCQAFDEKDNKICETFKFFSSKGVPKIKMNDKNHGFKTMIFLQFGLPMGFLLLLCKGIGHMILELPQISGSLARFLGFQLPRCPPSSGCPASLCFVLLSLALLSLA
jgi:hypothetical protein